MIGRFFSAFKKAVALETVPPELPWQWDMSAAPRDGSEIQISCHYGAKPWTARARFASHPIDGDIWEITDNEKFKTYICDGYRGRNAGATSIHCKWRPIQ